MASQSSKEVVARRIRNRIIEYLETAASAAEQRKFQRDVPQINVADELFNQWEDWMPLSGPAGRFGPPVYSEAEAQAICRFHAVWDSVAARTPAVMPALEAFIGTPEWMELAAAAREALMVFMQRGRLSD